MPTPNISIGQIAIDPTNKIFYFKKLTGELVSSTLDFLQDGNTQIVTGDNVTITASLTVDGNLTVNGTTTTINTETVLIEDNIIVLNSNVSATPSTNAGIEIERGTSPNVSIRWNESTGKWQFTNDGSTYLDISSIIANSVILGTHTVGNYVSGVSAGTGVTISHTPGEGSTPSFSIGQPVGTTDTVTFNTVNANLTGNVTGTVSDISNHGISDLGDVTITSVATNQGLIWNGSAWVNSTIPLNLDGLSDVIITAATPNQVLKYDGTNWINAAAPGGSFAGTTYSTTVGDGSASTFVINHGLSTRNVVVSINENNSPYSNIQSTWEATTLNSITVYFASPPSSDSIAVSVYAAVSGTSTGNVNSYATTIGDGSALQYTITHNLSSRDIILQARNANSPYENYNIAWEATTINTATVYFDSAPASNSVRIKVIV